MQNAELGSDNYFNNYTTNNQQFDAPNILYVDPDVTSIQNTIARLRYMASFGLDSVFPRDPLVTPNDKAEIYICAAWPAYLRERCSSDCPRYPTAPSLMRKRI